jgi:hypothetical protein
VNVANLTWNRKPINPWGCLVAYFVAIDRTRKFAVARLVDKVNRKTAWEFLEVVLEAIPDKTTGK